MKRISLLMIAGILCFWSCSQMSDTSIATVDGKAITTEEMKYFISPGNFESLDAEIQKEKILEICRQYQTHYYLEEKHDLDSGSVYWEKQVWMIKNIANRAYQDLIVNTVWSPKREQEVYDRMGKMFKPSHILISYDQSAGRLKSNRSKEDALALATELMGKVTDSNFADMAKKYSEDQGNKNKGGALNWGSAGSWVNNFEDAVYSMSVGDIKGPIETEFGYHIIKLDETKLQKLPPLEEYRQDLKETAFNMYKDQFQDRHEFVFDSLATAFPVVYNDSLLTDFMDRYIRLSQNVFYSKQFSAYDVIDVFEDSLTLGHIGNIPINRQWITKYLKIISLQVPPRFESERGFKDFVTQSFIGCVLYNVGLDMDLNKTDSYKTEENVYLAKRSLGLFDKLYIYEQINPDDSQLQAFYEAIKDSLYLVPEKASVKEVLVSDSTFAVSLLARIEKGESISALASEYSVRNIGKKNMGIIPPFKKGQYGKMGTAAFDMQPGELGGPYKVGKHYSIIKKISTVPSGYKTMKQVKYRLLTDYRRNEISNKRNKVYSMLDKNYKIKLNKNFIK